jgi:hypothetical protein
MEEIELTEQLELFVIDYSYIFDYFIGHVYTGFSYGLIGAGSIFAIVFTVSIIMKNVQGILTRN